MTGDPLDRCRRAWRIPSILGRRRPDEPFPDLPEPLHPFRRTESALPAERPPAPEDDALPSLLPAAGPPPGRPRPEREALAEPSPRPGQPIAGAGHSVAADPARGVNAEPGLAVFDILRRSADFPRSS